MKYTYINRLNGFEFHDSYWILTHSDECQAVFTAEYISIHKDLLEWESDCDMRIDDAYITFTNPKVNGLNVNFGRTEFGTPIFSGEYKFNFSEALKDGVTIHYLKNEGNKCVIEFHTDSFLVNMTLNYSEVKISFDEITDKAWYERMNK